MPNSTMRAIRFHDYGGPEQLRLEELPRPQVQPGMVLVRVKAAGVNPWDWKLRAGHMRQFIPVQFPAIPGIELAGVVEEIGAGVTEFKYGDAVYGSGQGTNAEYVVVPATGMAPKPESLSFDQAAGVPIGAQTAWRALGKADLKPGQRVLVLGAAGGVGVFVVQLARWQGARVIGSASAKNLDYIRSLGAEEAIDYQSTPVESAVDEVDVVIDTVGGETGVRALDSLRRGGILVQVAGMPPTEQAQQRGVRAESVGRPDPTENGKILREITQLIDAGQIRVDASTVLPLAEAYKAHSISEQGHGRGRIVLHIAD